MWRFLGLCGCDILNRGPRQREGDDDENRIVSDADGVLPRIIIDIDTSSKTIHTTRHDKSTERNVYALSHRWESRDHPDIEKWKVQCDDEESFDAHLFEEEVRQLQYYLQTYHNAALWLDYICIDQISDKDKHAQVSIMGDIYVDFISLPVGHYLRPDPPRAEYFHRGWTFQERSFGRIHFPFKYDSFAGSDEELTQLAIHFGSRLVDLFVFHNKLHDVFDGEDWRVSAANNVIKRLQDEGEEEKAQLVSQAKEMMISRNTVGLAKTFLQYREMCNLTYLPDDRSMFVGLTPPDVVIFQSEMFSVNVSVGKDRLFGIWGVPATLKGFQLQYDDPRASWASIASNYPWANFAYYHMPHESAGCKAFLGFTSFASVETVVMLALNNDCEDTAVESLKQEAEALETTTHDFYGSIKNTFTLAWGSDCLGFACSPPDSESNESYHFVIGYDALEVMKGQEYFEVHEAFQTLVATRLCPLKMCEVTWKIAFEIEKVIFDLLPEMIKKHEAIAKYKSMIFT